jgi:hypothetical protein
VFEVVDDVEEGAHGEGVVAGLVGDVEGDGDALGGWFGWVVRVGGGVVAGSRVGGSLVVDLSDSGACGFVVDDGGVVGVGGDEGLDGEVVDCSG